MKIELENLVITEAVMPDLRRLKELSEKLQLSPRRESVIQWHNYLEELQSKGLYITPKAGNSHVVKRCKSLNEDTKNTVAKYKQQPCIGSDDLLFNDYENKICGLTVKLRRSGKVDTNRLYNDRRTKQIRDEPKEAAATKSKKKVSFKLPNGNGDESSALNDKNYHKNFFKKRTNEECCKSIKEYATRTESETTVDISQPRKVSINERYCFITQALERMRTDLLDMRIQDNTLARQLLDGRHELLYAKAEKTCQEHADMIESFSWELELEEELTEQLRSFDLPSAFLRKPDSLLRSSSPLRLIGISRMTMESRRFSVI